MFEPNTLVRIIQDRTKHALLCGVLKSIPTEIEFIEDGGIRFVVRIAANLTRKDQEKLQQVMQAAERGKERNPFLPYDENMFVADISETHVCLLNKFNVVDRHILIVTRAFEDQENLLTLSDFEALWTCMLEFDGLGFYNGGSIAGASQQHKHLQMVPLPLGVQGPKVPIEAALAHATFEGRVGLVPQLPFGHAFTEIEREWLKTPFNAARQSYDAYREMLQMVDLLRPGRKLQAGPYNLLLTREWMLVVPRSQESFQSIPVNALGFAGSFFVRDEKQLSVLRKLGPMKILKNTAT